MQGRTFLRIMIDNLFLNNPLSKALSALVNFCNEQNYYNQKELKFLNKMPLNKTEINSTYKNRFIFTSTQVSGVNNK